MLTDAQYTTLANDIRGSTDQAVIDALAAGDYTTLTAIYNGDSTFWVWKSAVTPMEYEEAVVWTEIISQTVGERDMWRLLTSDHTRSIDATSANVRDGIAQAFDQNTTSRGNLLAAGKRLASLFEELYATGTGTNGDPGTADPEGPLSLDDLSTALNDF